MTQSEALLMIIVALAAICVYLFLENRTMAADLTALKQSVANAVAKLDAAVAAYKAAEANAADPAALAQMKTDLDTAVAAADAVLNPPPAAS